MRGDEYHGIRQAIMELFHQNKDIYRDSRLHTLLCTAGKVISDKVIRRIMKEEELSVTVKRKCKYN